MKNLILMVTGLLFASSTFAMTWQELEHEINSVEAGNPQNMSIIARFSDIVQMLVTYNEAQQTQENGSELFCFPPQGSLQLDEVVSMVRAEVRRQSAAPDSLVQELVLRSFRAKFPCG